MKKKYLALFLAGALGACGKSNTSIDADTAQVSIPVVVSAATSREADNSIRAVGVVKPLDEARLAFKLSGVIQSITVDEGREVKAGELLAQLQQTEINAMSSQANEAATKARRDLERAQKMFADGVVTREQLDDLTSTKRIAEAGASAMRFTAQNTRIVAPSDGVVIAKLARVGETIGALQPVLSFAGKERGFIVRVSLADVDAVRVHKDDPVDITLDAFPGKTLIGSVREVAAGADPMTGTFSYQITIPTTDLRLLDGLIAHVRIHPNSDNPVGSVHVPVSALLEADGGKAHVYVVDADGKTARRRDVELGPLNPNDAWIIGGLRVGEMVVSAGAPYLRDGCAVRVTNGKS
jgi:membrane fusion protein, multidrug efflux system